MHREQVVSTEQSALGLLVAGCSFKCLLEAVIKF